MGKIAGMFTGKPVDKLATKEMLAKESRRKVIKLFEEIEKTIFAANREIIHKKVPNLDREMFVKFSVRVAEARADYLKMALDIVESENQPSVEDITTLSEARHRYEELLRAFEETERLVERGYSDIS